MPLALLASCVTTQIHLVESPTPRPDRSRIAILVGGIHAESGVAPVHADEALTMGRDLARRLEKANRRGVSEAVALEDEPSLARMGFLAPRWSSRGSLSSFLSPGQVEALSRSRFDAVILLSIRTDETWTDVHEGVSVDTEHVYCKDGCIIATHTTTTYTTSSRAHRRLVVESRVFEIRTGRALWHASSEHTEVRSRSSCSAICFPPPPPFPDPPTRVDVMENISRSIARKQSTR